MYKTLRDVERVIEKQKPDSVLDVFIQSYLEGLYYLPLFAIQEEYEQLLKDRADAIEAIEDVEFDQVTIEAEYKEIVARQTTGYEDPEIILDPETGLPVDPRPLSQEMEDVLRIESLETNYSWLVNMAGVEELETDYTWLIEQQVTEADQIEYDSFLSLISEFVPEVDPETGLALLNQSALTAKQKTRKKELEAIYLWLPGEWTRNPPDASINIVTWKQKNFTKLRVPHYKALDTDFLNEALYDARQGDSTKLNEYDVKITAIKNRFPKP